MDINNNSNKSSLNQFFGYGITTLPLWLVKAAEQQLISKELSNSVLINQKDVRIGVN
jgi:hypothetical protein